MTSGQELSLIFAEQKLLNQWEHIPSGKGILLLGIFYVVNGG